MTSALQQPQFTLNSDYFPHNPNLVPKKHNIYLGGIKSPAKSKITQPKGITLTKIHSPSAKLTQINCVPSPTSKNLSLFNSQLQKINPFSKQNFTQNLLPSSSNSQRVLVRPLSSPLLKKGDFFSSSVLGCKTNVQTKIQKQKLFSERSTGKIKFTYSSSVESPTISISKVNLLKNSMKIEEKVQQAKSVQKTQFSPFSREKIIILSPVQHVSSPMRQVVRFQQTLTGVVPSRNYPERNKQSIENIYYHVEASKPTFRVRSERVMPLVVRPLRIEKKNRPTSPMPVMRESMEWDSENSDSQYGSKEQSVYIPSLKNSKSTMEEQEWKQNGNEMMEYEKARVNEEYFSRMEKKESLKPMKNSIKSLWDSVEKCAVSVIYENIDGPMEEGTGFSSGSQKGYNDLEGFCNDAQTGSESPFKDLEGSSEELLRELKE